jgi:putative tricarboxylic transport membrane protein
VTPSSDTRTPAQRLLRWGLPVLVLGLGLLLVAEGYRLPLTQAYAGIGPGFLVLVIGLALLLIGAVIAIQVARGVEFEPEETEGADVTAPTSWFGLGIAVAAIVLPVGLIGGLGFPLAGGISYALVTRAYGSRSAIPDLLIGIVVASVTWFMFTKLGVQLGPFFPLLGAK